MPIKFEITTKDGGTLHTASKYCEEDINIVPKLQNKTITENGTVSADDGYAGLGSVTVDVDSDSTFVSTQEATGFILQYPKSQAICNANIVNLSSECIATGEIQEGE